MLQKFSPLSFKTNTKIEISTTRDIKPFLKWAGGKRALLPELLKRLPKNFNNYFEPFLGGGAMFFELKRLNLLNNKNVFLSDKNSELINTYEVVRDSPNELLELLKEYQNNHSKEFYYKIREMDRNINFKETDKILRATRFIYLNKTCFNGLYRVNSNGFYNVPIGSYKNPNIYDEKLILNASYNLQNVHIENLDFFNIVDTAKSGDFVYLDPPYYPLIKNSNFTSYNETIFLDNEQIRVFELFINLNKKGVSVLKSNSNTEFIKKLYKDYEIEFVECHRAINSKANSRGKIEEILVRGKNGNNKVC
jgi:DNA adenine methylase